MVKARTKGNNQRLKHVLRLMYSRSGDKLLGIKVEICCRTKCFFRFFVFNHDILLIISWHDIPGIPLDRNSEKYVGTRAMYLKSTFGPQGEKLISIFFVKRHLIFLGPAEGKSDVHN